MLRELQTIIKRDGFDFWFKVSHVHYRASANKSARLPVNRTITVYNVFRSTIVSSALLRRFPTMVSPS